MERTLMLRESEEKSNQEKSNHCKRPKERHTDRQAGRQADIHTYKKWVICCSLAEVELSL